MWPWRGELTCVSWTVAAWLRRVMIVTVSVVVMAMMMVVSGSMWCLPDPILSCTSALLNPHLLPRWMHPFASPIPLAPAHHPQPMLQHALHRATNKRVPRLGARFRASRERGDEHALVIQADERAREDGQRGGSEEGGGEVVCEDGERGE